MTETLSKGVEIKEEVLATYPNRAKSGLGFETFGMIKLFGEPSHLRSITTFVKENFDVYKENILKWGEHEVHIWTSQDGTSVHLTPNGMKNGEKRNEDINSLIRQELSTTFKDLEVTAIFGLTFQLTKERVEEFIFNFKFDNNQIPFEKFNVIRPCTVGYPKPSKEAMERYLQLDHKFKEFLLDKKVIVNGLKGRFKRLSSGEIAFFKLRARKTYYKFSLNNIQTLETH